MNKKFGQNDIENYGRKNKKMKQDILDVFNQISKYQVKKLNENNVNEIYKLEKTQPEFFKELHEKLTKKGILEGLLETPTTKSLDDKYFLGFYKENQLIAILDIVIKYPNNKTTFIGLFMVDANFCGQGVGSAIFDEITKVVKALKLTKIQLGYVETNQQSKHFWLNKCGFKNINESHKHEKYTIQVCEKKL